MVAAGIAFAEIAKELDVSRRAITGAIQRMSPRKLCNIIAKRNSGMAARSKPIPIDLGDELLAIRSGLHDTRSRIDGVKKKDLSAANRFRLELMTADHHLRWIEALLKTNAEMMKVAGFLEWQEELLATLHEASPELRDAFLRRVTARGHLAAMTQVPATLRETKVIEHSNNLNPTREALE